MISMNGTMWLDYLIWVDKNLLPVIFKHRHRLSQSGYYGDGFHPTKSKFCNVRSHVVQNLLGRYTSTLRKLELINKTVHIHNQIKQLLAYVSVNVSHWAFKFDGESDAPATSIPEANKCRPHVWLADHIENPHVDMIRGKPNQNSYHMHITCTPRRWFISLLSNAILRP